MTKITQLSHLNWNTSYSYADYLTWRFEKRVELIKGKISLMSPAHDVEYHRIY